MTARTDGTAAAAERPGARRAAARALARRHAGAAIEALADILSDPGASPAARVSAAAALLNWGYGRPAPEPAAKPDKPLQRVKVEWGGPPKPS